AGRGVSLQWLGVRRCLHSFPTRRSSDLEAVRADTLDLARLESALGCHGLKVSEIGVRQGNGHPRGSQPRGWHRPAIAGLARGGSDRKSTRLNSSHVKISYAVFCLKKKNE